MNSEFDAYIKNYRKNLDQSLSLSGESSEYFAEYKALKLKEWMPARSLQNQKILDFGCGDGLMTYLVSQYFPLSVLYGIDPSAESVKVAQEHFTSIKFSVNYDETSDLDFEDNTFDIIFSAGTFHHIPFDRHQGYLQEIFRVLKPQGCFVLFELNPFNPLTVRTFKNNPIDKHATMLYPSYARAIMGEFLPHATLTTKYYCFYPRVFKYLRWTERFMTKIPVGALYAVIAQLNGNK